MSGFDPDKMRLNPGQCRESIIRNASGESPHVGFFLRSSYGLSPGNGEGSVRLRAGVIHHNDVLLVLTMIGISEGMDEYFDVWWNYHAPAAANDFRLMSRQDTLEIHFCGESGPEVSLLVDNEFKNFFTSLPGVMAKTNPWTDIEFDRAVRGFCAKSYPLENLWGLISAPEPEASAAAKDGAAGYQGFIPPELQGFYTYNEGSGHCIMVIPSMLAAEAEAGNPSALLHPAPVRTVLRCGFRWLKGHPVAPIPFIPGHGLAVPPEDTEM
jgi:hypothetical protein